MMERDRSLEARNERRQLASGGSAYLSLCGPGV